MTVSRIQLVNAYIEHGNVLDVGTALGIEPSVVARRLLAADQDIAGRYLNPASQRRAKTDYAIYQAIGRVIDLARELGVSKAVLMSEYALLTAHRLADEIQWGQASPEALRAVFDHYSGTGLTLNQYGAKFGISTQGMRAAVSALWPQEWEAVAARKMRKKRGAAIGRDTEHRLRDRLAKAGWVLLRSAGSRGAVDIAALRPGVVLFIQVKRSGMLGPSEWNALMDTADRAGAIPLMAENPWPGCWRIWRLTDRKVARGPQPMVEFDLASVA